MKNYIFWNVDTQVDFIEPTGKLYVQDAECIKPILANLTSFAKNNDIVVVNTCDWHLIDSKEFSGNPDYINTFPPHCLQQTFGAEFIVETKPEEHSQHVYWNSDSSDFEIKSRNIIVYKDKFDVFAGNQYSEKVIDALHQNNVKDVYLYGVTTNVCVKFAVLGLAKRGFSVHVIEDAVCALATLENPLISWKKEKLANISVLTSKQLLTTLCNK